MEKDTKLEYIIEEKCAEMKGTGINEPEFAFMHPTTYNNFTDTFMSRNRFMVVGPEKPTKITHFQCMYGKVELIQSFQVEEGDVKIMGRAIAEKIKSKRKYYRIVTNEKLVINTCSTREFAIAWKKESMDGYYYDCIIEEYETDSEVTGRNEPSIIGKGSSQFDRYIL